MSVNKTTIVVEGDATVMRDWLAGGQFYQIEIDGEDLLTAIERGWLNLSGDYDEGQISTKISLGAIRVTVEALS